MRPTLAHLRDQALVTAWAVAGVAAAALAASVHAPAPQARLVLDGGPIDTAHAGPGFAVEADDYLQWADAAYAARRADAPADPALASEHAALRLELARRGLPVLP